MTKVVWRYNFEESMKKIEEIVKTYPYVSMDTEFPGFLFNSPKDSDELTKYEDLRRNVDQMMLIQLGLTFSDENGKKPSENSTWEFNFRDFDPDWDTHVPKSIEMLKKGGIDFQTNKVAGISLLEFGLKFKKILLQNPNVRWIVFHGFYDIAYILKTIRGGRWSMPLTLGGFLHVVRVNFRRIFDLKYIAKYCPGLLDGELSLARLGTILHVERIGTSHQAGSDSLLTSSAFSEMKIKYGFDERRFEGYLYGIQLKIDTYQPQPDSSSTSSTTHGSSSRPFGYESYDNETSVFGEVTVEEGKNTSEVEDNLVLHGDFCLWFKKCQNNIWKWLSRRSIAMLTG